jgi:hypothetical protein
MSQDYSPSLVTKNLVFCGDAAMKSAAGPATLLYDKVNDNNGTMYNGSCLDFDGTDDYVTIPHNLILDNENALTIECWINTSFDAAFPGEIGVIRKGSGSASGWSNAGWSIRLRDDIPAIAFRKKDDTGYWDLYTGDKIIDGNWHHIVGTFDTTTLRKYVDGVQTQSTSTGQAYLTTTENLEIGRISAYLDGNISNVRVYNKALSAANVKELYDDSKIIIPTKNDASGGFVAQTNLKGHWPLSEGAGTLCYDGSGNGNTGTMTNMDAATDWLTGQTGAPQLVEGYNRPLLGDGATDLYVNCGDPSSDVDIGTGDFALGYWINPKTITGSYVGHVTYTAAAGTARFEVAFHSGTTRVYTTNGSWNDTLYGPPLNTWTHFLWIREAGVIYLHINGSSSSSWSLSSTVTLGPCTALKMMNHSSGGGYASIDGLLNEVVFYVGTSLSDAQKAALAATGPNGGPLPPNPASGPSSLPSTSYLKGYWRNDSDVTWTDLSGSGNDGTVTNSNGTILFKQGYNGSASTSTGRDGQGFPLKFKNVGAIGFNGSTDYTKVLAQSVPELDDIFDGGGTASAWIYAASDGETSTGRILHKRSAGLGWRIECRDESGGFIRIRFQQEFNTTDGQWQTAVDVPINKWVYVCVTYDSDSVSNDATIYINGVSSSSEAQTPVGTRGTDAAQHLYIGNRGVNDYTFDGQIANAQLYNRALTYAEIQQNYNSFKTRFGK